jgi:dTDP-4-amino-4,6-dideoxygalactose transaminase
VRVTFCDMTLRNVGRRHDIHDAAASVIGSGRYILGPAVERFEREWAEFCGAPHCVGVASGTAAISLALQAEGIGYGAHVLVPAATCTATFNAVSAIGAHPIPVDVDDDGLIDVCLAAAAINERVKAIVPVHLYGQSVDLAAIYALAQNHDLKVVVDSAQGHGLPVVGTTAFSFYPTKNLGAMGDAGAVVTNSAKIDAFVRNAREPGGARGGVSRLDEMQAAILSAQLPNLGVDNIKRHQIASAYNRMLTGANVKLPRFPGHSVWHQYVIRHPRRDELRAELLRRGVETGCHYSVAPHLSYAFGSGCYPKAEALFAECISLPIGPEVTLNDAAYVAEQVRACA